MSNTPEQAMQQVLQAESDAQAAIRDCELEARQVLVDARNKAQSILAHSAQRITRMEMHHQQQLDRMVRDIEDAGTAELSRHASEHPDPLLLQQLVRKLAAQLCIDDAAADQPTARR